MPKIIANKTEFPQTWYKVDSRLSSLDMSPVTVHRETPTKVEILDSRNRLTLVPKGNDWHKYFPTQSDAVEWIVGALAKNVLNYEGSIERAKNEIECYTDLKAKAERRLEVYTESIKNNEQSN